MSNSLEQPLLEALLDSWDRNNTILLNLLRALPDGGLEVRAMRSKYVLPLYWTGHAQETVAQRDLVDGSS